MNPLDYVFLGGSIDSLDPIVFSRGIASIYNPDVNVGCSRGTIGAAALPTSFNVHGTIIKFCLGNLLQ